jgi:ferredoxin
MFGLPLIIRRFAQKLEFEDDPYLFAIATCGGIVGLTLVELDKLLQKKGKKFSAGFVVVMPGNYTPLYGAKSDDTIKKIISKEEDQILEIAEIIKNKEGKKLEKSNFLTNLIFSKFARAMSLNKIAEMDKDFWVKENCNSCGLCETVCPVNNIKLQVGEPVWQHHCEQCMACMQYCPEEAIQLGKKTENRKRYRNPMIDVSEIIAQQEQRVNSEK